MYLEDTAGVIVNPKGEMEGSTIIGPIGKKWYVCETKNRVRREEQ